MTEENLDMAKLERIRGRIELFRESVTIGPKGMVLEDMIWMEAQLRKHLKRDDVQNKFDWIKKTTNITISPPKWEGPFSDGEDNRSK